MRKLKEASLDDVCLLVTDGTHDTPKRVKNGFPLIKAKEIVGGNIDFETCDQISEEEHLRVIARSKPEYGDTLFAHIGASLGEAAFVKTHRPFSIKNIALFKPNPRVIDESYLYYLVISPAFQELAKQTKTGSAQPFLSLGHLRSHRITYHVTLNEQREIASILSAYDDLIENNTRRIRILEEMAQSLYREWFVHFRFPGHKKVKMVDSLLGKIPEGWASTKLSDIALVNASNIKRGEEPEEIDYIDIASVSTGYIEKSEALSFTDAPGRARRRVKHGDIIWATVRPNRKSYSIIMAPLSNLIVSTGFAVITAVDVPYTYLYQAMTTEEFVGYLSNHAKGSAYPAVTAADFLDANILQPPRDVLKEFNKIVEPIFHWKQSMLKKNAKLCLTRNLLLSKLFLVG